MYFNNNYKKIVDDYVKGLLYNPTLNKSEPSHNIDSIIQQLLKLIVGTSRSTRLGPKPSHSTLSKIKSNLKYKIKDNLPLETRMCFGCKKTWDKCPPGIDIAEIFTLLHFNNFINKAKEIYPPGIKFHLFLGDAWYDYIYKDKSGMQEYFSGLCEIIDQFAIENIQVVSMFSFHKKNKMLYKQCDKNFQLLKLFWDDSSEIEESLWSELESYKNLRDIGWIGTIPSLTRNHYLNKLTRYLPNDDENTRIEAVLKYFAYGLMLKQNNLVRRNDIKDCTFEISVLSPPPGMPKKLRINRVYLRSLPTEISTRGAPCWTIMGILKKDNNLFIPSTLSPRDSDLQNIRLIKEIEYRFNNSNFYIPISIYE